MYDRNKVEYVLSAEYDDIPVRGNAMASGDDALDKQVEDEILARLERGDVWAWALVKVRARYEGLPFEGVAYLGCCSYEDEEDFRKGGYYESVCAEAQRDLEEKIAQTSRVLAGGMKV